MLTPQQPVGSGFSATTTAAEVMRGIDLSGKVAIVTGGYSGLGLETVRVFLAAGARVIVPARDVARATAQLADVAGAEVELMDLLDPHSIDAFAGRFLARNLPLDILVNSAGIMAVPELTRDARGFEIQFATNHLGHFQLVGRLWPALVRAEAARVVSVSSLGHWFWPMMFDDPNYEHRPYNPWSGYGQSKTANALFAVELDRRGKELGVRAFSLHPGGIPGTGLEKHVPRELLLAAGFIDANDKPILDAAKGIKSIEQGAATQVWCAVSPQLEAMGGVYCENVEVAEIAESVVGASFDLEASTEQIGVQPYAVDPHAARDLWELSERLLELKLYTANPDDGVLLAA